MGTPEAIRAAVGRVAAARDAGNEVACVVSAMQRRHRPPARRRPRRARRRPRRVGRGREPLRGAPRRGGRWHCSPTPTAPRRLRAEIAASTHELRSMCESIAVLRELTPRAQDALVARGERMLARHLHGRARRGRASTPTTSTPPTSSSPSAASAASGRTSRAASAPRRSTCCRCSTQRQRGGHARLPRQRPRRRGGHARPRRHRLLGGDPRAQPRRRRGDALQGSRRPDDRRSEERPRARACSRELHYREAAELAFYGAKVLHPRTMIPLVDRKIPLFVQQHLPRRRRGTRIADDVEAGRLPGQGAHRRSTARR